MCSQDIFLVMFDKQKQRLLEYTSDPKMTIKVVSHLIKDDVKVQFSCENYNNSSLMHEEGDSLNGSFKVLK